MALPESGRLAFSDVVTEFGGEAPHKLSEYYGVAGGVPSSGKLMLRNFYGKSAVVEGISVHDVEKDYSPPFTHYWLRIVSQDLPFSLQSGIRVTTSSDPTNGSLNAFPDRDDINLGAGVIYGYLLINGKTFTLELPGHTDSNWIDRSNLDNYLIQQANRRITIQWTFTKG